MQKIEASHAECLHMKRRELLGIAKSFSQRFDRVPQYIAFQIRFDLLKCSFALVSGDFLFETLGVECQCESRVDETA